MSTTRGRSTTMKAIVAMAFFCILAITPTRSVRPIRGGIFDELIQLWSLGTRDVTPVFSNGQPKPESLASQGSGDFNSEPDGTKWALLIAGSSGYGNYRHQADVCHAYQLLRRNGLKDEHIVVFMADDIASSEENPRPGTLINRPGGPNVYKGVPKDYTGEDVNLHNLLAALLGNASAIQGGSGKVIASGPHDQVFVFYSDHGGPGILGMPEPPFLLADDLVGTLLAKHRAGGFRELVFYLEACESGSIFEGLLPPSVKIYATTAANAEESSWGTYCPGMDPAPPTEYWTCLGDLYSVAWMEDSDVNNLEEESLLQQYELVRDRTSNHGTFEAGSHVMMYGEEDIDEEPVAAFLGAKRKHTHAHTRGSERKRGLERLHQRPREHEQGSSKVHTRTSDAVPLSLSAPLRALLSTGEWEGERQQLMPADVVPEPEQQLSAGQLLFAAGGRAGVVEQREAELLFLWNKYTRSPANSLAQLSARSSLLQALNERRHIDQAMTAMVTSAVGEKEAADVISGVRSAGLPVVDDWACLRGMVRAYESSCGRLTQYGMKHMRAFANLCNAGISVEVAATAAITACPPRTVPLTLTVGEPTGSDEPRFSV